MQLFFQKMRRILSGDNENLRQRMFYIIALVCLILGVVGATESAFITDAKLITVSLLAMMFLVVLAMLLEFYMGLLDLAAMLMGLGLCGITFPAMFFLSGGIRGGATIYFCLNIVYVSLLFEGTIMYILYGVAVMIDLVVYGLAWTHPQWIVPLESEQSIFVDSLFSAVAVGFAVAIMVQLHIRAYDSQRKTIKQQKEELQITSSEKNSFFTSMSHEIRSPINTIMGLNEMILRQNPSDEVKQYAASVQSASRMLLSLVNDVLDLSQMESGKMEIVPVVYNTTDFITELSDMMQVQLQQKDLEFQLDIDAKLPRQLRGDKKRVQQILINLLTNAAKYTNEGSVTFTIKEESRDAEHIYLRFAVTDTGIGIKKEDIEGLFDVFRRMDVVENANVEGTGLGLPLAHQLVKLMGGEMMVDSIYRKGSTFTVLLRQDIINTSAIGELGTNWTVAHATSEKYHQLFEAPTARILVVDDNPMNISVMRHLLRETKVQIDSATSGAETLEKTKEKIYHLILLDHLMPQMDGVETIRQIRSQDNGLCREIPIVAMTANMFSGIDEYYRERGFDAYLDKPVDGIAVEKLLLNYLPGEIVENRFLPEETGLKNVVQSSDIKRKRKIAITTDCVADLTKEDQERYHIGVMYLYIKTEMGRFADTREIDVSSIAQFIEDGELKATADSVSVEEYEAFFAEQLLEADEVIHISMASDSGKSYQVAVTAAESFGHVHVIDSKQISCGQALLVLYAAKQLEAGRNLEELIPLIGEQKSKIQTQFLVPTARYFYNGKYTSKHTERIAALWALHPVLKLKGSRISVSGFLGGELNLARKRFIIKNIKRRKINPECIYVTQVGLTAKEQELVMKEIKGRMDFQTVYMQKASFSCSCNAGPGTFGFAYYVKDRGGVYEA